MAGKMPWERDYSSANSSMGNEQQKPWERDYSDYNPSQNYSQPEEDRSWGIYNKEGGSVLNTAWEGAKRLGEHSLAAMVDNPETSRYQVRRAEKASKRFQEENDKLGYTGQLVSGAAQYAPVVAGAMLNPALGATLMGASATAETLAAQKENNQDYDWESAGLVGAGSAGLNMATGGLASRFSQAGQAWGSPLKQSFVKEAAKKAAIATVPDAVANAGQQGMTNVASGRDFGEGLKEAAIMGGVAAGGMHGVMAGGKKGWDAIHGWNAETETPINKSGKSSVDRQAAIEEAGGRMPKKLRRTAVEYDNKMTDLNQQISNTPYGKDASKMISQVIDTSLSHGTPSAISYAMKTMLDKEMPINGHALNIDVGTGYDHGGSVENLALLHGFTPQEIQAAGSSLYKLGTSERSKDKTLTPAMQQEKIQKAYTSGLTDLTKPINDNLAQLKRMKRESEDIGGQDVSDLNLAIKSFEELKNYSDNSVGKNDRRPSPEELRTTSYSLMKTLHDTNLINEMVGLDGNKGSFNPVQTIETVQKFHDMSAQMYPSVRDGTPNSLKEGINRSSNPTVGDVSSDVILAHFGIPPARTISKYAGKFVTNKIKEKRAEKKYNEATSTGKGIAEEWSNHINQAAESGDFKGGATEAAADLQSMGINPGSDIPGVTVDVDTAPVQLSEASEPVLSRSNPEMADGMARRPEPRQEAPEPVQEDVVSSWEEEAARRAQERFDSEERERNRSVLSQRLNERRALEETTPVESVAEPEAVTVVEPETQVPRGNPDDVAKLSREPAKRTEVEQTPEPEAPKERPDLVPRKAKEKVKEEESSVKDEPSAKEEEVTASEEVVTEPVEEKRVTKSEVLRPLIKRQAEIENTPRNKMTTKFAAEKRANRELLENIENEVNNYALRDKELSESDIWNAINDMGGIDQVTANGRKPASGLNALMTAYKNKKAVEAKEAAKVASERAKAADEAANEKLDEIVGKNKEEIRENTRKTLKSKGLSEEVIDKAFKMAKEEIGDDFAPSHIGNYARRIAKEEADAANAAADKADRTQSKIKGDTRTIKDTIKDLEHYADTLGLASHDEVKKIIASATRTPNGQGKALGEGQVRSVLNRMHKVIEADREALEAAKKASKDNKEKAKYENKINVIKHRLSKAEELNTSLVERLKKASEDSKRNAERKTAAIEEADAAKKVATEANERLANVEKATKELDDKIELNQEQIRKEIKEALHEKFADLKPEEVEHLVRAIADKVPEGLDGTHDRDFIKFDAMLDASEDAMIQLGKKDYAAAIKHTKSVIEKAMKRKEITDDEDLWFSTTDKHLLNEHMSDNGPLNAFYGLMYEKARVAIFGDSQSHKKVRYPEKMINRKLKEIEAAKDSKEEGGIDAVGVK